MKQYKIEKRRKNIKALTQYIRKTPHTIKIQKKTKRSFFMLGKAALPSFLKKLKEKFAIV